jgi:SAM-dependent methyltransferase
MVNFELQIVKNNSIAGVFGERITRTGEAWHPFYEYSGPIGTSPKIIETLALNPDRFPGHDFTDSHLTRDQLSLLIGFNILSVAAALSGKDYFPGGKISRHSAFISDYFAERSLDFDWNTIFTCNQKNKVKILDIGSNYGYGPLPMAIKLKERGITAYVDTLDLFLRDGYISSRIAAHGESCLETFRHFEADAHFLALLPSELGLFEKYNAINVSGMLEVLLDPISVLSQAWEMLENNGCLIIETYSEWPVMASGIKPDIKGINVPDRQLTLEEHTDYISSIISNNELRDVLKEKFGAGFIEDEFYLRANRCIRVDNYGHPIFEDSQIIHSIVQEKAQEYNLHLRDDLLYRLTQKLTKNQIVGMNRYAFHSYLLEKGYDIQEIQLNPLKATVLRKRHGQANPFNLPFGGIRGRVYSDQVQFAQVYRLLK